MMARRHLHLAEKDANLPLRLPQVSSLSHLQLKGFRV